MTGLRGRMRPAVPAPPIDELAKLREQNQQLRNERATLAGQLRDTARERDQLRDQLRDQRDAGRLMLDAALKGCEAKCAHAHEAAKLRVQLGAMQDRLNELQAANEAHDSPAFLERVEIPAQRDQRR